MTFKDHFSGHAPDYRQYRPGYPAELFSRLAELAPGHATAWDCATGSGQAAIALADHFAQVIATDASANQIAHALPCPGVTYRVAAAEHSGLADASVDLISVAQAVHWFDLNKFAAEARRVMQPDGVLAVWTYVDISFDTELNVPLDRFHTEIVHAYWPPERRLVDNNYADIALPFVEIPFAPLQISADWDLAALLGYLNTWSAVKNYQRQHGRNPVELIQDELASLWGDPQATRRATWPLIVRAWRNA